MASSKRANEATSNSAAVTAPTKSHTGGWDERGATADQAAMSDIDHLRFEATTNGRYHTARQGWYEFLHRASMFVVVIGGTAAVAEAIGSGRKYSWLVAMIPTLAGTVDLVFDFAGKAALHAVFKSAVMTSWPISSIRPIVQKQRVSAVGRPLRVFARKRPRQCGLFMPWLTTIQRKARKRMPHQSFWSFRSGRA